MTYPQQLSTYPHAVYRAYDNTGQLLYIGMSCDPDTRLNAHRHQANWFSEYHHHELTWYDGRDEAQTAETEAIRSEKPIHNIKGYPAEEHVRVTLNIPPELYRQFRKWTDSVGLVVIDLLRRDNS